MTRIDTIVAAATPPGRGSVGIVRVSGPKTPEIAAVMLGDIPTARRATFTRFLDAHQQPIDAGVALFFPAPHSYTGEHVLELQGHGGPVCIEAVIARVLQLGARRALPGEFTQRAFLNDKLDLAQAEAIADLIDAGSRQALRAAMRSLQGEFSAMVQGLNEAVIDLRTYVEAAIDFPEEEIDFLADRQVEERLAGVRRHFDAVEQSARQGRLLREGMTVVIAGRPNAGKSSLLNRLAGYDAAIVTEVPGTTRDPLREHLSLDGLPVTVVDTAGLRETNDPVEREGVRRARLEVARADRLLWVADVREPLAATLAAARAAQGSNGEVTVVANKIDLAAMTPQVRVEKGTPIVEVSALTGAGIDLLVAHLKQVAGIVGEPSGTFSARRRHLEALERTRAELGAARAFLGDALEISAEHLRNAQTALSELTGELSSDDLLGEIFATFCIGK